MRVKSALRRKAAAAALGCLLLAGCVAEAPSSRSGPPADQPPDQPRPAAATAPVRPVAVPAASVPARRDDAALAALPESNPPEPPAEPVISESFVGQASWYGRDFHGRLTASGEPYDMAALTAAHQTLPFGSRVRVTNLANGRSVVVVINDRGPFAEGRLIDLSHAAAKRLGILEDGVAEVRLDVLAGATEVAG